jgi:hypothetical protein
MFELPTGLYGIFLTDLREPEDNSLRLTVSEAKTLRAPEEQLQFLGSPVSPIVITAHSRHFEFTWEDYVTYLVRNESFALREEGQPTGIFLEKKSSAYLRYLEEMTFATSVIQKPMRHWAINCLNHCIDVASFSEPAIREISVDVKDRNTPSKAN